LAGSLAVVVDIAVGMEEGDNKLPEAALDSNDMFN
jgi:hypothetical protein